MSTNPNPVPVEDDSPIAFTLSYLKSGPEMNCDICALKLETERWTAQFSSYVASKEGYAPLNICSDCLERSDKSSQRLKRLITTAADEYERHVIRLRTAAALIERVPLGNPAEGDDAAVTVRPLTPFEGWELPF
jgi:hypothetical protein